MSANLRCPACEASVSHRLFASPNIAEKAHIHRCSSCASLFVSPCPLESEIAALYDESYYFHRRAHKAEIKRMAVVYARTIGMLEQLPSERSVLEIGSGKGYLLAMMRHLGWRARGVELSACAASFARDTMRVLTHQGTIGDYVQHHPDERASLVLAIDVIEHVISPAQFIRSATHALAPGGALVIDTPNANAAEIDRLGGLWRGFNPYHLVLLSRQALIALVRDAGLTVVEVFSYNNSPLTEPVPRSARGRLRRTAALMLGVARRVFGIRSPSQKMLDRIVAKMATRLTTVPSYRATDDYAEGDGPSCRGENLVLVATRNITQARGDGR